MLFCTGEYSEYVLDRVNWILDVSSKKERIANPSPLYVPVFLTERILYFGSRFDLLKPFTLTIYVNKDITKKKRTEISSTLRAPSKAKTTSRYGAAYSSTLYCSYHKTTHEMSNMQISLEQLQQYLRQEYQLEVIPHAQLTKLMQSNRDLEFFSLLKEQSLSEVMRALPHSTAQLRQDLFVLSFLQCKSDGFFVEFGATNGIDWSNTHLLETQYGWNGILAEPATTSRATAIATSIRNVFGILPDKHYASMRPKQPIFPQSMLSPTKTNTKQTDAMEHGTTYKASP
jgi:hypothetical protein